MINGTFPSLNDKESYYLLMKLYDPSVYKPFFQQLLDDRTQWVNKGELASDNVGVNNSTNKVVIVPYTGGLVKRYQYSLIDNPSAKIYKLGFTVQEVLSIVNS